jgi:hypothetical protein
VPKLIAVKNIVLVAAAYGIDLGACPTSPTSPSAGAEEDRREGGGEAGRHERGRLRRAQPAHNKAVASGTGTLIVPVDKADDFKATSRSTTSRS